MKFPPISPTPLTRDLKIKVVGPAISTKIRNANSTFTVLSLRNFMPLPVPTKELQEKITPSAMTMMTCIAKDTSIPVTALMPPAITGTPSPRETPRPASVQKITTRSTRRMITSFSFGYLKFSPNILSTTSLIFSDFALRMYHA